eukprot:Cvel_9366.t1-p1 / transcript=Cvel_9366.t1 / gene=Cvel_9366 / organism=Chromera_velia_CCMP2878 / gene_product=hypothetical protein / transcript_product=hypothetical protein / location=Cvel_scaffold538:8-611(-) / protein_length=201 / sequence_SO=supercontig / SO=protein_coding / is_pseudo=false
MQKSPCCADRIPCGDASGSSTAEETTEETPQEGSPPFMPRIYNAVGSNDSRSYWAGGGKYGGGGGRGGGRYFFNGEEGSGGFFPYSSAASMTQRKGGPFGRGRGRGRGGGNMGGFRQTRVFPGPLDLSRAESSPGFALSANASAWYPASHQNYPAQSHHQHDTSTSPDSLSGGLPQGFGVRQQMGGQQVGAPSYAAAVRGG